MGRLPKEVLRAGFHQLLRTEMPFGYDRVNSFEHCCREEFTQHGTALRDLNDRGDESLAILKLAATFGVEPSELVDRE